MTADSPLDTALLARMRLGAATSAYQIEGAVGEDGRCDSIWDAFGRRAGAIPGGETADVACDHYHRWQEDVDLMADLGLECYRFSVAWPRVVRPGGGINQAGLDFYSRLTDRLLSRGIEPIATLYHWDLPQWLEERGGWRNRDTAYRFGDYAELVASRLGDRIGSWITHNEPWVASFVGHAEGSKAPGDTSWPAAIAAAHHLLLSHGLAVERVRGVTSAAQVGITLNLSPVRPASAAPADAAAAVRYDGYLNRWFLDPVLAGSYPADLLSYYEQRFGPHQWMAAGDSQVIASDIDFLGVNYYFPALVRAAPGHGELQLETVVPDGPKTRMGWPVDPAGLTALLLRLCADYKPVPVWITENGIAADDPPPADGTVADAQRTEFLRAHLAAVLEAVRAGVPVERYLAWSLLDNFEWEFGYGPRFGIVHVDYETQARTPKDSALWYRSVIASRSA
jgi:beta-glucosidase